MRNEFVAVLTIVVVLFLMWFTGHSAQEIEKRDAIHSREYQFDVDGEGYYLYDGKNYLGFVPFGSSPVLDSIIIQDNDPQ